LVGSAGDIIAEALSWSIEDLFCQVKNRWVRLEIQMIS